MGAITVVLRALAFLLAAPSADADEQYDRAASCYGAFRWLWIRLVGAPAERAMLAELGRTLGAGDRVLDAGCGRGTMARAIHALEPGAVLTMLDRSPAMLASAADVPGRRQLGSVLELPFPDGSFEVVIAAWVLETIPGRERAGAIEEFTRVLAPGGLLLLGFCSRPTGKVVGALSAPLRYVVHRWFAGEFLSADELWQGCRQTRLASFRGSLATTARYVGSRGAA